MPELQNEQSPSEDAKTPYEALYKSASATSDDRFNAYRRLKKLDESSMMSLTCSSLSLIIVSLIQLSNFRTFKIPENLADPVTIVQNFIPIIILAISIIVTNCRYGSRAEKMHECARQLNHIKKILKEKTHLKIAWDQDYESHCENYNKIINQHDNHENIDRYTRLIDKSQKGTKNHIWVFHEVGKLAIIIFTTNIYKYNTITLLSIIWPFYIIYKCGTSTC